MPREAWNDKKVILLDLIICHDIGFRFNLKPIEDLIILILILSYDLNGEKENELLFSFPLLISTIEDV